SKDGSKGFFKKSWRGNQSIGICLLSRANRHIGAQTTSTKLTEAKERIAAIRRKTDHQQPVHNREQHTKSGGQQKRKQTAPLPQPTARPQISSRKRKQIKKAAAFGPGETAH